MGALFSSKAARIHFPAKPEYFDAYKSKESSETIKKTLRSVIETRCPSLLSEFRPAWWLFNGHLQTIYCVLGDFSKSDRVLYQRTYLRLKDGGTLGLDFTPVNDAEIPDDRPVIVVLHGLTGGSYESYVRSILSPACTPLEKGGLGYRAVVVNFRGCAGVPVTSPQLYSAGHTEDIRQALMYISRQYPRAPLIGLGFSLGANVLVRYLAEEGKDSRLVAACSLACPWDLAANNDALNCSLTGRYIYSKGMGSNLLNLLKRHRTPLAADPEHRVAKGLPAALALKSPKLDEFDEAFTRIAGGASPPFPFPTAQHYYAWASSHKVVANVRVPFLAINSADDPVVQKVPMEAGGNGYAVMAVTPYGGHLGWFESSSFAQVRRWITKPVLQWIQAMIEDLVLTPGQGRKLYVDTDGYLREEGRDDLGCKEVAHGDIIDGVVGEGSVLQGL